MSAVPTAAQIRQSFLDFFKSKDHTIVPSDNVGYTSRDGARIFTNAGMNQFVPIFLGERSADVDTWPGVLHKGLPTRAADTQKCIRAGGKHNDLEDVGLDTYHHTLFEMLGNWSFGDYFKKEAISWAWELIIEKWKFPPTRVFATIYQPGAGDPADRDQEAWDIWAEKFRGIGLDPDIHIVNGNKKDNFWMMGDTGPCGPCTEIHIDLTPGAPNLDEDRQRAGAKLVNGSDASCIEIWNNVFIQYNANPDGSFVPLPAKHVDTGMGFERVCSIIQGTKNFTDFENAKISNYDTDVFKPIFDELTKMCGKTYQSTLPKANAQGHVVPVTEQEKIDVAFRVIADHLRTLSFAIADGIQPGNSDRNYTLRRILRRAVKYGRTLEFKEPFFYKLVDVLAQHMGDVFPELRTKKEQVKAVLKLEEEAFNRTLDKGIEIFETIVGWRELLESVASVCLSPSKDDEEFSKWCVGVSHGIEGGDDASVRHEEGEFLIKVRNIGRSVELADDVPGSLAAARSKLSELAVTAKNLQHITSIPGASVFQLYDTFGFPLDLTELLARERGLTVDTKGFDELMEKQKAMAREAGKKNKQVVSVSEIETKAPTKFIGYDTLEADVRVLEVVSMKDKNAVVLDVSTCYAEMGGQVGDAGQLILGANTFPISATTKVGNTWLHFLEGDETPAVDSTVKLVVDAPRRHAIERHHTVTHILHWALHEVVSKDATQKGSSVTPDKLTFDFNSAALTAQQLADIERLVNERIVANDPVSWSEVPYVEAKANNGIMALFGEKYGDLVRVVQIGGQPHKLDGWSMELCGGTHTRGTGEIGLFRLVGESAVAAGVRRIEAIAGLEAYNAARADADLIKQLCGKVSAQGAHDIEKKLEALLEQQKTLEKNLKAAQQREASGRAKDLLSKAENNAIIVNLGDVDADYAVAVSDALKGSFNGIVVLATTGGGNVALIASVAKDHQAKVQAGKIIQTIAPIVGGKGGGKPDFARGGGKDVSKVDAALAEARRLIG
ncbi:alanine--tRNA ligase [Prosthecobacter sp.]|uniref:alanine--tRNA ligase n=1 Tax=Prosthecobacter sp. TaxID=1965333 RepID=UPI002ABCC39D|nr:alanine--tRNA ligase [Prosthecobacter sp.]MDZ4402253.1 alanine--tRNA ligase [Prosthecobacter sp.]